MISTKTGLFSAELLEAVYNDLATRDGVTKCDFIKPATIKQGYADGPGIIDSLWTAESALIIEVDGQCYVVAYLKGIDTSMLSARAYEPTSRCFDSAMIRTLVNDNAQMRRRHLFMANRYRGMHDRITLRGVVHRRVSKQVLEECLIGEKEAYTPRSSYVDFRYREYPSRFHADSVPLLAEAILSKLPQLVTEKDNCSSWSWEN